MNDLCIVGSSMLLVVQIPHSNLHIWQSFSNGRYFLITPKLLPGLKYHRNMKVLTINNGKFVPEALDIANIIEQASQLQQD
jgi:hypothetical protein